MQVFSIKLTFAATEDAVVEGVATVTPPNDNVTWELKWDIHEETTILSDRFCSFFYIYTDESVRISR